MVAILERGVLSSKKKTAVYFVQKKVKKNAIIIPLNLNPVLLLLDNSKLAY